MNRYELIVERPWLLLLIIPALAIIIVPFFILPKVRRRTFRKIAPVVLHSVIALLLVMLIAGVSLKKTTTEQTTMIVIDLSESTVGVKDLLLSEGKDLRELIVKESPVGVIAFGKDQVYAVKQGADGSLDKVKIDAQGTDIAAALKYAAEQLPGDKAKRIVLLSDGKQTDGDALKAARELSATGVRVDAVYFDTERLYAEEMQISDLLGEDRIALGETVTLKVVVDSVRDGEATVYISDNGSPTTHNTKVEVKAGSNVYEFKVTPTRQGTHTYTARLSNLSGDTISKNNELSHCVEVDAGSSILVISRSIKQGLEVKNLLREGAVVEHRTAHDAPLKISELCQFDQVVLVNIDADDLPAKFENLLEVYVSKYGKSLLTIGGNQTYSFGNMTGTLYEQMLPVDLDYKRSETKEAVALALVIDCSRSMGERKLQLAQQGAIRCVNALNENDYVAVISFAGGGRVDAPLKLATKEYKDTVKRSISAISTRANTNYCEALTMAYEELKKTDAPIRHVIFLSDGQPGDDGYFEIAKQMADNGVTVSTIGIEFNSSELRYIAEAGNGRYDYAYAAEDLPNIMFGESQMVASTPMMIGDFAVKVSRNSALTEYLDMSEVPAITGYIGTIPKEDAFVYLTVGERNDPLYAVWQYGNGTVASFMSDLSFNWTDAWSNVSTCKLLVRGMSDTIIDHSKMRSSLAMDIQQNGSVMKVSIETAAFEDGKVTLNVETSGKNVPCKLLQIGQGLYTAEIPTTELKKYELTASLISSEGETVDYCQATYPVPYNAEYNAFAEGGEALLSDVCTLTGGTSFAYRSGELETISESKQTVSFVFPLFIPFGIAAVILYVIDVAIRRIRWKDLVNLFRRSGRKTKQA